MAHFFFKIGNYYFKELLNIINNQSETNKNIITYSTCFDHSGGLLKVMNTQFVKIVHIMIMLNTVKQSQGSTKGKKFLIDINKRTSS